MNALVLASNKTASRYFGHALKYESIICDSFAIDDNWDKSAYMHKYNLIICKIDDKKQFDNHFFSKLKNACLYLPCTIIAPDELYEYLLGLSYPFLLYKNKNPLKSICFDLKNKIYTSVINPKNDLIVADLVLNRNTREAFRFGKKHFLKNKEFQLLNFLMKNPDRILTRTQIIENVWDYNAIKITKSLEVHINKLRKKIDFKPKHKLIETVHFVGYKLCSTPYDIDL